ncbi:choloylglycine hydrolase [Enterococcus sp. DIV2402]|uniref:Choloylglycine hydrolase n=1 Tax=Candidatus Enterococcus lowellii TaxID=2230877 RepID=A0ABZ2SM61_9ENTE|nr:choloylglycine hydrolase family protein [Enterococcus sp. DIV2402]MBO0464482.1 choloylglycine hydrolase family protein [Enterococcus sp. DIV2402]
MCTSFTLQTNQLNNFLARTMDFSFQLNGKPIVIPRGFRWQSQLGFNAVTRFGFISTGRDGTEYVLADGMNEKGVAMAELYFSNEARYSETPEIGKINLAPHEFILWVLGNIASIDELKSNIATINLVHAEISLLGAVAPLHYIVTDKTGTCVVIETNRGMIEIKENPLGVLTNSPELEWHLKNLSNYLSLTPNNFPSKYFLNYKVSPNGLGSGTSALPGGLSSPERFVRAVYTKEFIDKGTTSKETLNAIFHLLNNFTIPKGLMLEANGESEYTQYRVVFNLSELEYYFSPYETQEIFSINLNEVLLNLEEPRVFETELSFKVTKL